MDTHSQSACLIDWRRREKGKFTGGSLLKTGQNWIFFESIKSLVFSSTILRLECVPFVSMTEEKKTKGFYS
jgi:hypothetical protein